MVYFYDYVGANPGATGETPCGSSAIDLTKVPIAPPGTRAVACTYVLAFANDMDGAGNFAPQWDTDHFSQQNLAAVTAANPAVNFAMSLGGGGDASWQPPDDPESWVNNAVASIKGLMEAYGLVGVDIDYEHGPNGEFDPIDHDSFVQCMSQVMERVSPAFWSIAPFTSTLDTYLDLYDASGGKPTVNFQAYSMETDDQSAYVKKYTDIRSDPRAAAHGHATIGFGISTDTVHPLGLQFPAVTDLCFSQFEGSSPVPKGLWDVAMIWAVEHSCLNGYPVEAALSGPPPLP